MRVCSICETSFHSQAVKEHKIIFTQDRVQNVKHIYERCFLSSCFVSISPNTVATRFLHQVNFLRCHLDVLLDANNRFGPEHKTDVVIASQKSSGNNFDIGSDLSAPVNKNCVRERPNSEIRVRVLIQVHISGQRIAKHLNIVLFALQYLQDNVRRLSVLMSLLICLTAKNTPCID